MLKEQKHTLKNTGANPHCQRANIEIENKTMSENTYKIFREEIKWLSIVIAIIFSVLFNYFVIVGKVDNNYYRIGKIEEDRAARWAEYNDTRKIETATLQKMGEDIAVIKTKLEQIENKLK